jgi:hypothetical protein
MKKTMIFLMLAIILTSCVPSALGGSSVTTTPVTLPTLLSTNTATPAPPTATATALPPSATPAPTYPVAGMGPTNFPSDVDPLTGLKVQNPDLLNRRPMAIKVQNLPRDSRPQWGLSSADLVYEYYTEAGTTRFNAVFYGQDAEKVGPIRSGRYFDANVVRMYKAAFIFGSADAAVFARFANSDFARFLVLENNDSCPALCRFDPNGKNYLLANTTAMADFLKKKNIDNSRQNLDGSLFKVDVQPGGQAAQQVYIRYSGAIYNRWDYDPTSATYKRFSDTADDVSRNNEQYAPLLDRNNNQQISAQNLVMLFVRHDNLTKPPAVEVYDMQLVGEGPAYIARDGQIFKVKWHRANPQDLVVLLNDDGTQFALKPGNTWFEVLGYSSKVEQVDTAWHFTWLVP